MEDEERLKKLEAGKAKLAEYRQRKAYADSQKKQKKKKKKKPTEDSEGDSQERVEVEPPQSVGGEEVSGGGQDESQGGNGEPPTTEFTFTKTLKSGETVRHNQTYKIEPDSEVSTTAEDCSSEVNGCHDEMTESLMMSSKEFIWEEVDTLQQITKGHTEQDMEDALSTRTQTVEELNQDLEEIGPDFGTETVQQLQDFEVALKQRDGIITQLTSNLQQAREEKDEIMKEFLALTEQSQKLQIQFQQLQAGETLRNTSHSSTAADLLQARQQLVHYQQQLEEINIEVGQHQKKSGGQLEHISQLQLKLAEMEMSGRRSEELLTQKINEKDLLIAERDKVILSREQSLRAAEEAFAQTIKDKNQLISEQTAIIKEHEWSLTLLQEELALAGRTTDENIIHCTDEKELIIAEKERVISERDSSLVQLTNELETSEKLLRDLQQQVAAKESELVKCLDELESTKSELVSCKGETESCRSQLEKEQMKLESCKGELAASRQKERMSSNEIMQLMGTVEDLQKRCYQGHASESDTIQKMQEDTARKLELLRAELDEMYGQQIVQMKQEMNLQHAARVQQMMEQHQSEVELLKTRQSSSGSTGEVEGLTVRIKKLQNTLEESQAMYDEARHELNQVIQEKLKLQVKVEDLLRDLSAAKEEVEQVCTSFLSQESNLDELQQLQETIDTLRSELSAAQEAAQEAETKHESEITNYKIKLEMLEREKDEVLDRMAESQEAELERLRTQLLFSHEEELTNLKEDLQRENFLKMENLLNEAAVRHQKTLDELQISYAEQLDFLRTEKATFATERDELLHQILGLKEELKLALHSPKADELVRQLQDLQVELEELRKGAQDRAKTRDENQLLLKKIEVLENQTKEQEHYWEEKLKEHKLEKETLIESNNTLGKEIESRNVKIETLTAENNQIQQQVAELCEETEKQRTTFSFAEKNFEVNYQELKEEYTCLIEAKTQLEERTRRETLEFEAKIARLQLQIQELEEGSRDIKMEEAKIEDKDVTEKDAKELMEKLGVALSEKRSLTDRLSEVTGQLNFTENKVGQLEDELVQVRQENTKVIADNESLRKKLEKEIKREQRGEKEAREERRSIEPECSLEHHHLQIESLQEEVKALQSLSHEAERDGVPQTLELHRLSQTPSPAAARSSGEGPVEGRSSPHKSAASGSNRRKRRQRSKQERKAGGAFSDGREEKQREEEERAQSTAEQEMLPQMQSQSMSCSPEKADKEDSTDGNQGDGGYSNRAVNRQRYHTERVMRQRAEEEEETPEHDEFRLQMEAQRLSLTQIHAAQLELLQEESDACTRSLELKLQHRTDQSDQDEQKIFKYQNMMEVVSDECTEIIQSFQKIFGQIVLERVDAATSSLISEERPATSESASLVLQARELYTNLQEVRARIEHEHRRLSHLQTLLKTDGNKIIELQKANDELKINNEKQISDLQMQLDKTRLSSYRDVEEQTGASASIPDLQKLKVEAQEKQLQLQESHQQEMEHLRAHYQQQAAETEERYATELFMLQQRLQDVTGDETFYSLSSAPELSSEMMEECREELKDLSEEELSEGGVELHSSARSPALTAQLQALRKALDHKYTQEVAALKEQHNSELRRLREEIERERRRREHREDGGERKLDLNSVIGAGSSTESLGVVAQLHVEERHQQERVEEEVAKAIVQMSVEFAQQTELARINKRARQTSTSMQTQLDGEAVEDREAKLQTPRASPSAVAGLEEEERQRMERELEEKNNELQKLKEALQKTEPKQALKKGDNGEGRFDEGDGTHTTLAGGIKLSEDDEEPSDKDTERNLLREANKKLSQVLVDVLKTTVAAEKTLGLHMQSLRDTSAEMQLPLSGMQRQTAEPKNRYSSESCRSGETGADNVRIWSGELEADEGLEMSQQMMDSLLLGAEPQLRNEEYFTGVSSRLQAAVEKMLMTITGTTGQLEHARVTQTELMRESFRHNQEIGELLQKQEELQERLSEEARAREQLALELHRAEGLIDGYTGERAALEEQLRHKDELQQSLEQELQVTGSRLHELEQERLQMLEERELLSRQQDAMREEAGPRELCLVEAAMVAAPEADLLEETEKLMKEKVDVQRQAEKENTDLLKQVKLLEAELEEQVNRVIELEHAQNTESGDFQQQIQALEKQLEKNRKFLDEQAVDREHERDFFQQEIQKLEQQLKSPQKLQIGSEQRNREVDRVAFKVEQLTTQLKEKADWCSELLLGSEQLRRELGERDEEIEKLESRIRELEQALLASAESLEKVEEKKQHESITEAKHSTLEAQLQTEREALERKEKEICNLEEQLEQFREELENKSEEVQQLHMQLEIQRKEISSQQQYLETRDSMLQVMAEKDREIALLNEQITKLQHMESASDNKEFDDREEMIKELESQVECLRSEQERLKRNKEEELEQLNDVIEKLQQELANIEHKQAAEEEEDSKGELESATWEPTKEEYNEMKQKMDRATKDLETLRTDHSKLLDTHLHLNQSAEALAEAEKLDSSEGELGEALREKTAALVVLQAEVQALEQSASSRVEELGLRIQELEDLVGEKDLEMDHCRILVEQSQSYAEDLQKKVHNLEENLRERVAAALVSQSTLEAFQQQSEDSKPQQELQRPPAPRVFEFADFDTPQMVFSKLDQAKQSPTEKVVHVTQKLRDLEVGLSGIQRDQELQKQLLSSSEEEVLEYERRLAVLTDLLSQMKAGPSQRASSSVEICSAEQPAVTELLGELQEVKDEASTTYQQLEHYKESCNRLQQELQDKTVTVEKLQGQLQMVSSNAEEETKTSELEGKLLEALNEAASTKEELSSCKESLEKLQELLQEREMTIAHLKGELFQVKAAEDGAAMTEVIQELEKVKRDATSTKKDLTSYQEHNEKLQEDLRARDGSIFNLEKELQEVRSSVDSTKEELTIYQEHNEKLQEDLRARDASIFNLEKELQEVRSSVDATKEELTIYQERKEKLQEDLQAREDLICTLKKELQEVRSSVDATKEELASYREKNEKLQEELQAQEGLVFQLEEKLQEVRSSVDSTKELDSYKQQNEKLLEDFQVQEGLIFKLEEELQKVRSSVDTTKELDSYKQQNEKLLEDFQVQEGLIFKLEEELQEVRSSVDSTKELDSYKQQNEKLLEDFQVQEGLIFKLEEELQKLRSSVDTTKELDSYKQQNKKLLEDFQVQEGLIFKLKQELQEVRSSVDSTKELDGYKQQNKKLLEDFQARESSILKLEEELQSLRSNMDTTKEELDCYKQQNEKLLEELNTRELFTSKLKEELQVVQTALLTTTGPASPSPAPQLLSSAASTSTSQSKRKGAKHPTAKGGSSKDKPSLSKRNVASSSHSNSSSGQQRVAATDSFTQTEPLQESDLNPDGKSATKEEMEEVIGDFQEKIAQMQELHAAEILDMEARHISESDNLRRDNQALEDECKAMKAAINKLCSTKAPPSRQDRPTLQFKDGYTSDSSSDYSQRTGYDLPSLQQELRTTPEGARRETDDPLPDRIKTLLREVHQEGMQVLSLSEFPFSEPGNQFNVEGWVKERDALLASVESLKDLITQMQMHGKAQTSGCADWRAELLDAVRQVFLRERSVLKNALYSQLDLLDTSDAVVHLNQLERRLAEQDAHHREAMGLLHTAERSSLVSEIHQLRGQLEQLHQSAQPGLTVTAERSTKDQRARTGTDGAAEADRLLVEELKVELSQTKLELETTLKAQHKHLKELDALRVEVSQKAAELDALNDQLTEERKRSREFQWMVEKEKCQSGRNEDSRREELEDLQLALEEQKAHAAQLTQTLEQERQASSQLSQKVEQDNLSLHRRLQELQVQLETERAKALEMSSALGRERELRTGISSERDPSIEEGAREDKRDCAEERSLLERLQKELDEKHSQTVHLLSQVEAQRLEVLRKVEELALANQKSKRDEEVLVEVQARRDVLKTQMADVQEQLEREQEWRKNLEEENQRLEERLNQLGQEEESGAPQVGSQSQAVWHSESTDRTKDWVLQQKNDGAQSATASPRVDVSPATHASGTHHGPWRTVDKIVGKLHLISSKIHSMTSKTINGSTAEVDGEELSWIQSSVDEVINMLQQSPGLPSIPESQSASLLPGGSSSSSNNLTERLLRQNAELTGFVSRLTEEKNDLRNHTLRLEEELRRYRQAGLGSGDGSSRRGGSKMDSAGLIFSQEQESWSREKIRLEKALHVAQSQLARLRGEIRSETLREITGPEADNSALKRMYGKYLRSESFRKALIYQKKYLLLLLGGFQECEEATLSLLSRMGGHPSLSSLESYNQRRRGLMRFRSAVRVSIALSRMRFLVKRWHKATGMSSTVSCSANKNGAGTEVRDSPYLHPSSVDMYRERGGGGVSSSRGRSGRESPRSGVSPTQHRLHLAADHGPLTCSHLQSYDPDRALTDYISRLEALQRRLGSVASGASSYAQLHFGLRR
ncbi:A-kinase anchor protein 9 [Nematolebias whitei]|uniref:A-kinase anchor protein 9 n=1 Tax=Nematolebias whitei TaxID=451745 RepID=UPI00189A014E|nr:A-kinase anchor protein 9 [Nematolebias whitei]